MNRLMGSRKASLKGSQTIVQSSGKRVRKEKKLNPPVTKKYKSCRNNTSKVRKTAKNGKLMNEWAENESSKGEIYEKPRQTRNMKKSVSNESVIYVGSYKTPSSEKRTIPIIDLTNSTEYVGMDRDNSYPKKLKTLYFPERNFERVSKLRKCLATTSLLTIPVTKKIEIPRKHASTTELMNKLNSCKLAVLNIPAQYIGWSDIDITHKTQAVLDKAELTESDYAMIDWIIDNDHGIEMEYPLSSTSGYDSSINNTRMSIDEFVKMYDTNSNDVD